VNFGLRRLTKECLDCSEIFFTTMNDYAHLDPEGRLRSVISK
jgi:hypothetical protein